ncbi:MAG: tagaturonate reductase [Bacteroidota bacterium]|nr:tagaturonate reductase [Bacteroidota bacterium]
MNLSAQSLKNISEEKVILPNENFFELPEKILQFGTGMLLRGLPDYFVDKANRAGIFKGRIVMVKTTSNGDAAEFEKQNGLYTLCVRGIQENKKIEENIICSSVSRTLFAQHQWNQILECAYNKNLKIIISNTTEVGIQLLNEDIRKSPPASFPCKLLAFLYERFKAFHGSDDSGLVIVPTELIPDNGNLLQSIVLELAYFNSLEKNFITWLEKNNYFCNSLVDRIVTGMPGNEIKNAIENELGYKDDLMIVCEVYRLWAIECDEKIKRILSFADADEGMVLAPDIDRYRELKLRLLNGTHTLTCGLSFLSGYATVKDSMEDNLSAKFIESLMRNEISPSIDYKIDLAARQDFISKVLDRFRNPNINHLWKNITLNYTTKMRMRCIPLLISFYKNNDYPPQLFTLGFAAYIYFMKAVKQDGNDFYGEMNGEHYLIQDEMAEKFYILWQNNSVDKMVKEILNDHILWGSNLFDLHGFAEAVTDDLKKFFNEGTKATLEKIVSKNLQGS